MARQMSWSLSRAERFLAVSLVMDFLPDEQVVAIAADAVNMFGQQDCHRLVERLTLRQRYLLLRMLAESILDVFPDPEPENPAEGQEHSHLAHVALFMPPVFMPRCHIGCGCWRDMAARRRRR